MLETIILSGTFVAALLVYVFFKDNFRFDSPSPLYWILFSLSVLGGTALIIWQLNYISTELARHSWPTVNATVIATSITGDRAYNPELICRYRIDGSDYLLKTDLNTPPFGRKRTRRQTAEIIIREHPVGSEILVHYNPDQPDQACVRTGPFWNNYTILMLGVMLFGSGIFGLLIKGRFYIYSVRSKKKQV